MRRASIAESIEPAEMSAHEVAVFGTSIDTHDALPRAASLETAAISWLCSDHPKYLL
jgi:hypothetical protein